MTTVAVIGLGYVGLPLAVEFGKVFSTIGFDISKEKISSLNQQVIPNDEVLLEDLKLSSHLSFTSDPSELRKADFILIAVPTLVTADHQPELSPLKSASKLAGEYVKHGATIIFESTVYPGATEEICIPEIEVASGMKWKDDFHVGYSPERVNPGDKLHTLTNIKKIVSGDDADTLERIAILYENIIKPGVHRASCIKVAEAAKIIENTQRDLNIALMNELSIISHLVGIDTQEVIEAASTKWNFMPVRPGLVGGHCIGVVPYYLTHKAEQLGYHPELILAARSVNENMGKFIADQTIRNMIANGATIKGSKVNIFGIAFKADVQDLSNSKVVDVIAQLKTYGVDVFIYDPVVDPKSVLKNYGFNLTSWEELPIADAIIAAVPHQDLINKPISELTSKLIDKGCFTDISNSFDLESLRKLGISVWRL